MEPDASTAAPQAVVLPAAFRANCRPATPAFDFAFTLKQLVYYVFLLAGLTLISAPRAAAFFSDSQYHVATEPSTLLLDSRSHWDSEASSDFIVYQRPIEWDSSWYHATRAFDLTTGSISSKQFLNYQRLKLWVPLTETVEFRLHWLQERDFEQDRVAMPLELRFRILPGIFVSAMGQPSLYKAEDDVGFALAFKPSEDQEIQLTGLWGDFQRNERTLGNDKWSKPPVAWTLTATDLMQKSKSETSGPLEQETGAESSSSAKSAPGSTAASRPAPLPSAIQPFSRMEIHYEPESVRAIGSTPSRTLSYSSAYLSGLRTFGLGSTLGYRIFLDRAWDVDHAASTNSSRLRSLNQLEYGFYVDAVRLRPGVNVFYRENHMDKGREYFREVLPTFWADLPSERRAWAETSLSLGYDATIFNRDSSQRGDDRAIEHRLNIKSTMRFVKAGELALLFTFDLDRFGSGETWEGGAGQFRLFF